MRFEESWYFLNLAGFRKLAHDYDMQGGIIRSKRHQSLCAATNTEELFTDEGFFFRQRPWKKENRWRRGWLKRDPKILVPQLPVCARCGRTERLQRDHVKPLRHRGKDEPANLQYLCEPCHKYKTTKDNILDNLIKFSEDTWRRRMWQHRLEVLEKLNPPGKEHYASYWVEGSTHYGKWYQRPQEPQDPLQQRLDNYVVKVVEIATQTASLIH